MLSWVPLHHRSVEQHMLCSSDLAKPSVQCLWMCLRPPAVRCDNRQVVCSISQGLYIHVELAMLHQWQHQPAVHS